jgi:hypothetical protein
MIVRDSNSHLAGLREENGMIVWNRTDRLIRQAKIAYRMWLALHPSVETDLQLKYEPLIAEKRYDRASCHEVSTTMR